MTSLAIGHLKPLACSLSGFPAFESFYVTLESHPCRGESLSLNLPSVPRDPCLARALIDLGLGGLSVVPLGAGEVDALAALNDLRRVG